MTSIFGYFDDYYQTEPAYDPGLEVDCPVCNKQLSRPVWTVSFFVPGDNRSYFYRMHRACRATLSDAEASNYEQIVVDAVVRSKEAN